MLRLSAKVMLCPAAVLLNTTLVAAVTPDVNVAPLLFVSVRVLREVVCPTVLVTLTVPALVAFKVSDWVSVVLPLIAPLMFRLPPAVVSIGVVRLSAKVMVRPATVLLNTTLVSAFTAAAKVAP